MSKEGIDEQEESLPSFSSRDLSQLISCWMDQPFSTEYETRLVASTRSEFQALIFTKTISKSGSTNSVSANEVSCQNSFIQEKNDAGSKRKVAPESEHAFISSRSQLPVQIFCCESCH